MNLHLLRSFPQETETIGDLFVDGQWFCHTLEDRIRPVDAPKVPGETAIPCGDYSVVITFSPKFRRDLPLLVDVPGFSGIRIHPGNTQFDTEGCILVGTEIGPEHKSVLNSRDAFAKLFQVLEAAVAQGISISIVNGGPK